MIGKRASHVGMMISFFIFISVILFVYLMLNSMNKTKSDKFSELDLVENKLSNYLSTEVYSVTGNNFGLFNCISFEIPFEMEGINLFSIDSSGGIISSELNDNKIFVQTNGFFKTFYGENSFDQQTIGLENCEEIIDFFVKK